MGFEDRLRAATPYWHVGIIVQSLTAAREQLAETMNVAWAPNEDVALELQMQRRPVSLDIRYCISTSGPPHLELIEQQINTPFSRLGLHHLGTWGPSKAPDYSCVSWTQEWVTADSSGTPVGAVFWRTPDDVLIEVCDPERMAARMSSDLDPAPGHHAPPPATV